MSEEPRGFDAVASRYDEDEAHNPALAHLRQRLAAHLASTFGARGRLLELGSGTGTEAAERARAGCSVALLDASPRLLERAQAKVRAARPGALLGAHALPASRVCELEGVYGAGSFDGAWSSLGPLNCEPRLEPVARGLARLLRPGAPLVLSVMNRYCAVESLWFAAHGRGREAARRWGGPLWASAWEGGPREVRTWYYDRRALERAFSEGFALEHAEALPLLFPPTWLSPLLGSWPRLFRALEPVELRAARWPLLRDLGDHVLVRLRRRA